MTTVEVICPSVPELTEGPKRNVPCTVEGCDKLLATTAALRMHVIKKHGVYQNNLERAMFSKFPQSETPVVQKQYYCPVEGCHRHRSGTSPFSCLWPLKQHYQQVHGERKHRCSKCNFPFAFEPQRQRHERNCGRVHSCSCGVPFATRQALCMHAMRKKHALPPTECQEDAKETEKLSQHQDSQSRPRKKSTVGTDKSSLVTISRILAIPVQASQTGNLPQLIVPSQPLQLLQTGLPSQSLCQTSSKTLSKTPSKSPAKVERFLLPKPTILSAAKAAALHPKTTQIVTINKGTVASFPACAAPLPDARRPRRTLAATQVQNGQWGKAWTVAEQRGSVQTIVHRPVLPRVDDAGNGQPMFRDLGINTLLSDSINSQTQTVVKQNSAHTQTPGDVIMQGAFMSAHIETPQRDQVPPEQEPHQQQQQQQQHQQRVFQQHQQQLQEALPASNRQTQTSQPPCGFSTAYMADTLGRLDPTPGQEPPYPVQTRTPLSANSTSSCDVQTDSWLSSLVQVNHQGTLTDIMGVPSQTDLSVLDLLNLSNSQTQTVISQSALDLSSTTESASTQTAQEQVTTSLTETSIQTSASGLGDPEAEKAALASSTMQTQTNFYSAYLDALLLNESQCQTSPGQPLCEEDTAASCSQQTQTLVSSSSSPIVPERDHQQTQTAVPDLGLPTNGDFLLLDMYTQTVQQQQQQQQQSDAVAAAAAVANTSLQTQTDNFLDYSLSSMQTQTMADFDLDAFDYQSISVQTDSRPLDDFAAYPRPASRTQVQTQTSSSGGWDIDDIAAATAAAASMAGPAETETSPAAVALYNLEMCPSVVTDSHTQTVQAPLKDPS